MLIKFSNYSLSRGVVFSGAATAESFDVYPEKSLIGFENVPCDFIFFSDLSGCLNNKGAKRDVEKFIALLNSPSDELDIGWMKEYLKTPFDYDLIDDHTETTIRLEPDESGNVSGMDMEEIARKIAIVVPALDLLASITYFIDDDAEFQYFSPAGSTEVTERMPIYCYCCGKEITGKDMLPDEDGNLYCLKCAKKQSLRE